MNNRRRQYLKYAKLLHPLRVWAGKGGLDQIIWREGVETSWIGWFCFRYMIEKRAFAYYACGKTKISGG